jgi:hypothetical protein
MRRRILGAIGKDKKEARKEKEAGDWRDEKNRVLSSWLLPGCLFRISLPE